MLDAAAVYRERGRGWMWSGWAGMCFGRLRDSGIRRGRMVFSCGELLRTARVGIKAYELSMEIFANTLHNELADSATCK